MRAALAVVTALVVSGAASAAQPPEPGTGPSTPPSAQRANVPRATGTGLAGVPAGGGTTVMGMSPGLATLLGIVIVGGVIAIVGNGNDEAAPAGTGSGGSGGSGGN